MNYSTISQQTYATSETHTYTDTDTDCEPYAVSILQFILKSHYGTRSY